MFRICEIVLRRMGIDMGERSSMALGIWDGEKLFAGMYNNLEHGATKNTIYNNRLRQIRVLSRAPDIVKIVSTIIVR